MSSENEDQVPLKPSDDNESQFQKKSKILYSRDFLLSLSELDVCKKLPKGFNASVLSEFEDASSTAFDQHRNVGSVLLTGIKHGESGPLLQNRSESSGSYGRGSQGRWDTRSSGLSDKDGDLQSDQDTGIQDFGKRFGNQTRRSWQNSEHDGLLGTGAFPRPTGYAGSSKAQGNDLYQLNRSTEPYQPPRPYKVITTYARKDGTDSCNDETFGPTECFNENRAEEERKRRASFELMRKEQLNALQEKHKQKLDNHKENAVNGFFAQLGNSIDEKTKNNSEEPTMASHTHNDSSRSSLHAQAPASRPLVPPGFGSSFVDKPHSAESSSTSLSSETLSVVLETKHSYSAVKNHPAEQNIPARSIPALYNSVNEKLKVPILDCDILKDTTGFDKKSGQETVKKGNEVWEDDLVIVNNSSCNKGSASGIVNAVNQNNSTVILEKLFSNALSKKHTNTPNNLQQQPAKEDDEKLDPTVSESSRFACCLSKGEKKTEKDVTSRELLSLIVNNEKSSAQVSKSNEIATERILLSSTLENVTPMELPTASVLGSGDRKSPISVLTCEDLEQSILAQAKDPRLSLNHSLQEGKPEKQEPIADGHASQHLLSMLQKGTTLKEPISSPGSDNIKFPDRSSGSQVQPSFDHFYDNSAFKTTETVQSFEKKITLEALFGASFMDALHSAEAPVSVHRGSVATNNNTNVLQTHGLPSLQVDERSLSSSYHQPRSDKTIHERDIPSMNNIQEDSNNSNPWLGGYGPSSSISSKFTKTGIEEGGGGDIQLPEEDSLITVGDTVTSITADPFSFENVHIPAEFLPENKNPEDLNNIFLNGSLRDGEQLRSHVPGGLPQLPTDQFSVVDPNLHHHLHQRPSSPFVHQMDHVRPLLSPLDHLSHRNPQMQFADPDVMHHNPHHHFLKRHVSHPAFSNVAAPRFDPSAGHPPVLHHMPVPRNVSPYHPTQGLPRGVSSSNLITHMPGYFPEVTNLHNIPLRNRTPNHGMGLPGAVMGAGGGALPEALERLIEMELRAKSKQIHHPFAGHIPGIYDSEDMNFRHRA